MNENFLSFCSSIHFVIVTYNGENYIKRCLRDLKAASPDSPIHIIDNNSTDRTVTILNELNEKPHCLDQNVGFGQANNIGINLARKQNAEFIFLLNQDAYLAPDSIKNIFTKGPPSTVHIHALLQLSGDGTRLDQNFRSTYLSPEYCPEFLEDTYWGRLKSTYPIRFTNAAAWLLPRNVIETIGGFNPSFFHYGEDDNYVHRAKFHGIQCLLHTDSAVYHDREERPGNPYFKDTQQKKRLFLIQLSHPSNKEKLAAVRRRLITTLLKKRIRGASRHNCIESVQLQVLTKENTALIEKNRITSQQYGPSFLDPISTK